MDDMIGGHVEAEGTNGIAAESVRLRFRWYNIGDLRLDAAGKLVFPPARAEPGVYRLEVHHEQTSVYLGEASDLRQRFRQYRNPGVRQQTNLRLNDLLRRVLADNAQGSVSVAEVLVFEGQSHQALLDLRLKAARVLIESAATVLARRDGTRVVLNLDKAFDRALGGR